MPGHGGGRRYTPKAPVNWPGFATLAGNSGLVVPTRASLAVRATLGGLGSLSANYLGGHAQQISAILAGQSAIIVPNQGWTSFAATQPSGEGSGFNGAGTRIVYVSSSTGNDANPGTFALPMKTAVAAGALMRLGKPDWLLFKKGDTFNTSNDWFGNAPGNFGGLSATAPMIFGAYHQSQQGVVDPAIPGSSRPFFDVVLAGTNWLSNGGQSSSFCDNMAFVGLHWKLHTPTADTGCLAWTKGNLSSVFLENCMLELWGMAIEPTFIDSITIRRCIFIDAPSSGLFCGPANGFVGPNGQIFNSFTVFQNIWDQNGLSAPDSRLRNIYVDGANPPISATEEFFARSKSTGGQYRSAGNMNNCIILKNAIDGFDLGHRSLDDDSSPPWGVCNVRNCYFNQATINDSDPLNIIQGKSSGTGIHVNNNLFVGDLIQRCGIYFDAYEHTGGGTSFCTGGNYTSNTFYKLGPAGVIPGSGGGIRDALVIWSTTAADSVSAMVNGPPGSTVSPQGVVDMTGSNPGGVFPDPTRDPVSYYTNVVGGAGGEAGMYAALRAQSKDNWNSLLEPRNILQWIRAGFNMNEI